MTRSISSTASWRRPRELVVAGQQGRALEAHADREQGLDGAVVQLLGDPLAVLEHGQALQLALEAAVLEGDRGLLGEGLDQLDLASRSSGPPRPLATVRCRGCGRAPPEG